MAFTVRIGPEAYEHIQQGIDWYNQQEEKLGYKLYEEIERIFRLIQSNPYFQVRYD